MDKDKFYGAVINNFREHEDNGIFRSYVDNFYNRNNLSEMEDEQAKSYLEGFRAAFDFSRHELGDFHREMDSLDGMLR
ncbi:MAG: hypothetical protein ABIG93_05435 [archaeon]|nr:hypothetical protein [Nanoarchaeota archaeon]